MLLLLSLPPVRGVHRMLRRQPLLQQVRVQRRLVALLPAGAAQTHTTP